MANLMQMMANLSKKIAKDRLERQEQVEKGKAILGKEEKERLQGPKLPKGQLLLLVIRMELRCKLNKHSILIGLDE